MERNLQQDIKDLLELVEAKICRKCHRYYKEGYICNHCNTDNSYCINGRE